MSTGQNTMEQTQAGTIETLDPATVQDRLRRREIVLIDVRTPSEYAFEHVEGALLYPMSDFDPANLPVGRPPVLMCGSAMRSHRMAERCLAAGLTAIAQLGGGFAAWKQAGLPYLTIDPATGSAKRVP